MVIAAFALYSLPSMTHTHGQQTAPGQACDIDLNVAGQMKDIVSNALLLGLNIGEADVQSFLLDAEERYTSGPALMKAAAAHFKMEEAAISAEVEKYRHINCTHGEGVAGIPLPEPGGRDGGAEVSAFAKDVTLHVVLHELGHAIIREFDIPVLGNEETTADAFATYFLVTYFADRAVEVLTARTTSLMIEAGETPDVDWTGEHDDDARRAFHIAALAMAADPLKYKPVADVIGMSEKDIANARDYGAEIHRSWRRVLAPVMMPDGSSSREARVLYDAQNGFISRLCSPPNGLASEIESAIQRFDWHSQVTVHFVDGDGGAGWSRGNRTITVHSGYVRRFIEQGKRGLTGPR